MYISTRKASSFEFAYWVHKRLFGFRWQLSLIQKLLDTIPVPWPPEPFSAGCGTMTVVRASRACIAPKLALGWILQRKGLKSNKIPLSSCSEDVVLTNSSQKARSCNLLLLSSWEVSSQVPGISECEAQAGKHKKSHRRCPFERLENVKLPATLCWGKSQLQQKALSTRCHIISSRFIHFSWHLSLVLQMLHYI